MTETKTYPLDTRTGLPQLSEGCWWSVEENTDYESYKRRFFVAIKTMVHVPEKTVKDPSFWGKITGKMMVIPAVDEERYERSRTINDFSGGYAQVLTPENILETAQIVARFHFEAIERERDRLSAESLLGAYPPKTLF